MSTADAPLVRAGRFAPAFQQPCVAQPCRRVQRRGTTRGVAIGQGRRGSLPADRGEGARDTDSPRAASSLRSRECAVDETVKELARGDVPELHRLVMAPGHHGGPVRGEGDRRYDAAVCLEGVDALSRRCVPIVQFCAPGDRRPDRTSVAGHCLVADEVLSSVLCGLQTGFGGGARSVTLELALEIIPEQLVVALIRLASILNADF